MDLELTEAQAGARDLARRFAREKLERVGVEIDRTHEFPRDAITEFGRLGMLGVFIPEKYGGAGLDNVAYALVIEEFSVECASTGVIVSAHSSLGSWPILGTGAEDQRARYLPKMASGEWLGCFALTEPQAGSDAAGQKTRAVLDGDSYVINGTKNFITNGPEAGICILFANTHLTRGPRVSAPLSPRLPRPASRSPASKIRWAFTARTVRNSLLRSARATREPADE